MSDKKEKDDIDIPMTESHYLSSHIYKQEKEKEEAKEKEQFGRSITQPIVASDLEGKKEHEGEHNLRKESNANLSSSKRIIKEYPHSEDEQDPALKPPIKKADDVKSSYGEDSASKPKLLDDGSRRLTTKQVHEDLAGLLNFKNKAPSVTSTIKATIDDNENKNFESMEQRLNELNAIEKVKTKRQFQDLEEEKKLDADGGQSPRKLKEKEIKEEPHLAEKDKEKNKGLPKCLIYGAGLALAGCAALLIYKNLKQSNK